MRDFHLSRKHSALGFLSLRSFILLCAREHKRHRLSAFCIPETHEANLHKCSAIMHVFKAPCMDLWVTLPSTGADIVQFQHTHHLKNCCVCPITTPFCSPVDKSVFVSICFGVCLSLDNDFTCAMSMHVLNNTCIHAHTCLFDISCPPHKSFTPICQLGDSEGHSLSNTKESSDCQ